MERDSPLQERIAAEAAEWFTRLQETNDVARVNKEFSEWILRSPEHVQEFLAASRIWWDLGAARVERFSNEALTAAALAEGGRDNIIPIPDHRVRSSATDPEERVRGRGRFFGMAASSLLVGIAAVLGWAYLSRGVYATEIGEQRSVTLADGSVVDINTHSKVRIDMGDEHERRVHLVYGEARFKVAKDARRPFIVVTPEASIRALGTVFNVRAERQSTAVAVLEGLVEVRELATVQPRTAPSQGARIELKAGQLAAVSLEGRIVPNAGPPLESVASWTERRLEFREQPLADVIAEFNRYHRKPIRIDSPALAGLKVSGSFDSSDSKSLIEYFRRFEGVRVEEGDDATRLLPPESP